MDAYEATRIVLSRIQNLDPENASRIMGLLLIQDHGEKEMIRLAFGPEALVHSLVLKARKELGLSSNSPPTPSTPPSPSPSPFFSRQTSSTSSRLLPPTLTIPNPSSAPASWSALSDLQSPDDLISPNCYTGAGNGVAATSSAMNSSSLPFYGNGAAHHDMMDELQLQDQLSFLNDGSPTMGPKNPDFYYPQPDLALSPGSGGDGMAFPSYGGGWGGSAHRRSCSVSDVCLNSDDPASGFGWKPCLYYARGYCKNGASCRFLHGAGLGDSDGGAVVGSPSKLEMMDHELLRSKSAHQQRLAAASQLMASAFPYSPKTMNLLLQQNDSQRAAAALLSGEDLQKYGRSRLERTDFSSNGGLGMVNPASRQIYLTFPADSTFREEDVSNYFSIYGPVQDVRIPYQQKRMFGFVTFVYPETVKLILAKGNPHFVCDARVLVKPYKEKGKVPDKKQQQQMERGDFSPCGTPTGLDSRDIFDLPSPGGGASMFYNSAQDMLWRRKLEEQALEIQSRRLMNLQLLDVKKHHHHHHRAFSTGSPVSSPAAHSPSLFSPHHLAPPPSSFHGNQDAVEENQNRSGLTVIASDQQTGKVCNGNEVNGNRNGKEENINGQESLEHNLPDSPFASPTMAADNYFSSFSNGNGEAEKDATNSNSSATLQLPSSSLDMTSFKSFNCQIPRFSSGHGHGAIGGMFAGAGGSTFPVGI